MIIDEGMYHFYNSIDIMGFKLVNTGLQMILDKWERSKKTLANPDS